MTSVFIYNIKTKNKKNTINKICTNNTFYHKKNLCARQEIFHITDFLFIYTEPLLTLRKVCILISRCFCMVENVNIRYICYQGASQDIFHTPTSDIYIPSLFKHYGKSISTSDVVFVW